MRKFNNLSEEMVLEILTRLPAESVLNCKLVCKQWKELVIHTPYFSQMHLNHLNDPDHSGESSFIISSRDSVLVRQCYYIENCHEKLFNWKTWRRNLSPEFGRCSFVGSCDGLICFIGFFTGVRQFHYGPAYICNPITREYIVLPTKGRPHCTGFGYSHSTNEYKVVKIYGSGGDSNVGIVQVYTLGSGIGWRNAGTMDIDMNNVTEGSGANGALHWVDKQGTVILAFHLSDEKFSQLPPPPPYLKRADVPYSGVTLGVLGDFLSATYDYEAGGSDIWLLKKSKENCNDSSWCIEFSFDCHESFIPRPFGYTKGGSLLCYGHNRIYIHDRKDASAKMDVSFGMSIIQAIPHKNTLVSLKVLGEKDTRTLESGESEGRIYGDKKLKELQNEV